MTNTIKQIAKANNINLYLNAKGDKNSGFSYRGNSSWNAEIYISKCDNHKIQQAIFFHELGHLFQEKENYSFPHQFHYELDAWLTGLKIGSKFEYFIDENIFFELLVSNLKSYQTQGVKYKLL